MLGDIQVAVSLKSSLFGRRLYRAWPSRWHAELHRLAITAGVLAMAAVPGTCSFSYQLDSLFAKDDNAANATSPRRAMPKRSDEPLAEHDLAIAREAASEVLARRG